MSTTCTFPTLQLSSQSNLQFYQSGFENYFVKMSEKEIKNDSVVHRPRQSKWPAIPMDEALKIVENEAELALQKTLPVTLVRPGSILAEKVLAKIPIPAVRTSIKDGYAVVASDGIGEREVVTSTTAGSITDQTIISGTCARVSTGSMIPFGADAVVQVENTELVSHDGFEEQVIKILKAPKVDQDIRAVGSDMFVGQILLEERCIIGSAEIGILAASGQKTVNVFRKPKVCIMSTGNELIDWTSDEIPIGKIRDTNRPQLMALFSSHGFKPIDGGIVGDTREKLTKAIRVAFRFCNVIIMSGGVSMGEKDMVKTVLQEDFGFKIHFGRVFMKPGLPSTFATGKFETEEKRYVFALPGNPVSAWVTAQLFAIPAFKKMGGYQNCFPTVIKVKLSESIKLDSRPEYRRAWLSTDSKIMPSLSDNDNLPYAVCTSHNQLSSFLLSTRGSNLLLRLPNKTSEMEKLEIGSVVDALVIGPI